MSKTKPKGSKTKDMIERTLRKRRALRGTVADFLGDIFDTLEDIWEKLDRRECAKAPLMDHWNELLATYKEAVEAMKPQPMAPQPMTPVLANKWIFDGDDAINLTAILGGAERIRFVRTPEGACLSVWYDTYQKPLICKLVFSSAAAAALTELKSRFPDWPLPVD